MMFQLFAIDDVEMGNFGGRVGGCINSCIDNNNPLPICNTLDCSSKSSRKSICSCSSSSTDNDDISDTDTITTTSTTTTPTTNHLYQNKLDPACLYVISYSFPELIKLAHENRESSPSLIPDQAASDSALVSQQQDKQPFDHNYDHIEQLYILYLEHIFQLNYLSNCFKNLKHLKLYCYAVRKPPTRVFLDTDMLRLLLDMPHLSSLSLQSIQIDVRSCLPQVDRLNEMYEFCAKHGHALPPLTHLSLKNVTLCSLPHTFDMVKKERYDAVQRMGKFLHIAFPTLTHLSISGYFDIVFAANTIHTYDISAMDMYQILCDQMPHLQMLNVTVV